jgi:hypothetical protein
MLSRRQVLQSLAVSAVGSLAPSQVWPNPIQRVGSAANRAQIVDADFDVTPYLAQLKSAGVKTVGRYYDRAYGTGIGESCYHHPLKTLTKAELTAIENAGLSVFVVFQHCGAQCVNFDLQNKETAEKGRKDAEAAVALAQDLGQPANTPIYFAIDFDPTPGRDNPLPAARIWPSIEAYFDQVQEVFARTRWQVGVYGAGITCQRLRASGKAKYFWLSSSLGHLGSPSSSTPVNGICFRTWSRSSGATPAIRSTPTWSIRRRPFRAMDVTRSSDAAQPGRRRGYSGKPRLCEKSLRDRGGARQRQAPRRPEERAVQLDVPHPDGRRPRIRRSQHDRGRRGGRLRPHIRPGSWGIVSEYAGVRFGESMLSAADRDCAQAGYGRLGKSHPTRQCTLTVSSSCVIALAMAASRLSVTRIGVPSAACSANRCIPGCSSGACG